MVTDSLYSKNVARIKVKKPAFFFFFWRSSSTKCWSYWVSGVLGVGLFQFGRDICLLYSVPERRSVQGRENQERAAAGSNFWAQPDSDYTLGTGSSHINICTFEQDLGWERGGWCFPGLMLGPQHSQTLLNRLTLSVCSLSACIKKRPRTPGYQAITFFSG